MNTSRQIIPLIVIFCVGWLVYSNTIDHPFVYDDLVIIAENNNLDDGGNFRKLFTRDYFQLSGERTYRPVATALSLIDVAIGGRNPRPFRITSVLIHSITGVLIFVVVFLLSARRDLSFFTALLFVVHPALSEAVNGSSFIEDPLAAAFFFGAFAAHLLFRTKRSLSARLVPTVLFLLAAFSKETAITFPFFVIVYEWVVRGARYESQGRPFRSSTIYYFAALFFYLVISFAVMKSPAAGVVASYPGGGPLESIPIMAVAFLEYLILFFLPLGLSVESCIPLAQSLLSAPVIASICLHVALVVIAVLMRASSPMTSLGLLFYLLNLVPISNVVPFGAVMAERYIYLPSFGLCLFLASIFLRDEASVVPAERPVARSGRRTILVYKIFLICACILFGTQTMNRNHDWRSGLSLWEKAVASCPESSRARTNYGRQLISDGDYDDAVLQLSEAVRIDPAHYEAWSALGAAHFHNGDFPLARDSYRAALRVHPSNDVRYNLAILYLASGRSADAVPLLRRILEVQPDWPAANYLLGNAFLKSGARELAEKQYVRTLSLDPDHVGAMGNLGVVLRKTGRGREARKLFEAILKKEPGNEFAARNLALLDGVE